MASETQENRRNEGCGDNSGGISVELMPAQLDDPVTVAMVQAGIDAYEEWERVEPSLPPSTRVARLVGCVYKAMDRARSRLRDRSGPQSVS